MSSPPDHPALSRRVILDALAAQDRKLAEEGVIGEICIYEGAAIVVAFNARLSTKVVDAVFKPPEVFRRMAADVAEDFGLPATWLNDAVKGFVSTIEGLPQWAHLRVIRPATEYLLAMKCMAARAPGYDTQRDRADIALRLRALQTLRESREFFPEVAACFGFGARFGDGRRRFANLRKL